MIIIKNIILYFIQIRHTDDFPSTGTRLVQYKVSSLQISSKLRYSVYKMSIASPLVHATRIIDRHRHQLNPASSKPRLYDSADIRSMLFRKSHNCKITKIILFRIKQL